MHISEIINKLKLVKYFIFDLDGVLLLGNETDESMEETFMSIDGFAQKLSRNGYKMAIFSGREMNETVKRLESGGIISVHLSIDKVRLCDKLIEKENLEYTNIFYMGDGLFDIPLLQKVGLSSAPFSARREVKRIVNFIAEGDTTKKILSNLWKLIKKTKEQN